MWTDRKAGQAETEGTVRGPQGSKKVENPAKSLVRGLKRT